MKLSETIQSDYFKSQDIPNHDRGGSVIMTIAGFEQGKYSDGTPTIEMRFQETHKKLGLNVTNRKTLMLMFGDRDVSELIGQKVELHAVITQDMQGNPCYGVRLRQPATPSDRPPTPVQAQPAPQQPTDAQVKAAFPDALDEPAPF